MKRPNRNWWYHLVFWILYIAYVSLQNAWDERDYIKFEADPHIFSELIIDMILVYTNLFFLLPRFFYRKKHVQYGIGILLLLLIGGLASRFAHWFFWVPYERIHDPAMYLQEQTNFYIPIRILRNAVEHSAILALTTFLILIQRAYRNEQQLRALEEQRHKAEWNLLKAQIHPHFFFNTLNSLYALTIARSDKGPETVLQLSELMSYVLYEANTPQVPLEAELRHLSNYIAIERLRFTDRLDFNITQPVDTTGLYIAPLLLLPFVENAFKHSLDQETEKAWIKIDISITGSQLMLDIANSFHPDRQKQRQGIGLANVRKRLDLSYPDRYKLHIGPDGATYSVHLTIPLHEKD